LIAGLQRPSTSVRQMRGSAAQPLDRYLRCAALGAMNSHDPLVVMK